MRMARLVDVVGRTVAVMPTAVVCAVTDRDVPAITMLATLAPTSTWEDAIVPGGRYIQDYLTLYLAMPLDDVIAELDAALRRETRDG